MKKLSTAFLFFGLMINFLQAQDYFEGTITFQVKVNGENSEQMAQYMPQEYEFSFKGNKSLTKIKGGMMAMMMGEVIFDNETGVGYMINHTQKVAYKMESAKEDANADFEKPTITEMDESVELLGYDCRKYKIVATAQGQNLESFVWVTKDIRISPQNTGRAPQGSGGFYFPDLDGFPLKVENSAQTGMGQINMEMIVVNVDKKELDPNLFAVPEGYEVQAFDPSLMMNPSMKKN